MKEPPGLQAERTVLAWTRTVLLVAAVAALIARTADSGLERGVAISLAAAGLGLAALTAMRRRVGIAGAPVTAPAGRTFGGLLAAIAALIAAGVVVIL
jgi:uncharacterized membrane protein YidH (DUF202 family)